MEMMSVENSTVETFSSNDVGHQTEHLDTQFLNHGDAETKPEIPEEEVIGILEVIAATGKFWHDWDTLKTLLSFRLKQVLAEYPEAQTVTDQQTSSLGKTYAEIVQRLDAALLCFKEGPPFTLQRLCEILLTARRVYPNFSKLALALEKNLLVTTTLTISTDPYPSTMIQKSDEPDKGNIESVTDTPLQNGVEAAVDNQDEEMAEAEEIDEHKVDDDKVDEDDKDRNKDDLKETVSAIPETSSEQSNNSEPLPATSPVSEQPPSIEEHDSTSQ